MLPVGQFQNYNQDGLGFRLELSDRTYCKLWYGVRLDYISTTKSSNPIKYYERVISVHSFIKYAPFVSDCFDNKLVPFVQGTFGFSSINPSEHFLKNGSNLALGYGLGGGLAYNFKLFKKCWMLEFDGLYYAPNSIERASERDNLQSFNVGLTLSLGL